MGIYKVSFNIEIGSYIEVQADSTDEARDTVKGMLDWDELEVLTKSSIVHREVSVIDTCEIK